MELRIDGMISFLEKFNLCPEERISDANLKLIKKFFNQNANNFTAREMGLLNHLENRIYKEMPKKGDGISRHQNIINQITEIKKTFSLFEQLPAELIYYGVGIFLTGNEQLVLRQGVSYTLREIFFHSPKAIQAYFNRRIKNMNESDFFIFLERHGPYLEHLDLRTENFASCSTSSKKIEKIISCCPNLASIVMPGNITGADLKILQDLKLTSLDLSSCVHILDADLRYLEGLKKLTDLNLSGCYKITDNGLLSLKELKALIRLNLSGCQKITGNGLIYLKELQWLTYLDLSFCQEISIGLSNIENLKRLTHLNLTSALCKSSDDLRNLSSLDCLTYLNLANCNLTDCSLNNISNLTKLTYLNVSRCIKTDKELECINKFINLTHLSLHGCFNITKTGVSYIKNLNLTHLNLSFCKGISENEFSILKCFNHLIYLNLEGCNISDNSLDSLKEMEFLSDLNLCSCINITDIGINAINWLRSLEFLNLEGCYMITNDGFLALQKPLHLNLRNTAVSVKTIEKLRSIHIDVDHNSIDIGLEKTIRDSDSEDEELEFYEDDFED